jgi:hypothetical protein
VSQIENDQRRLAETADKNTEAFSDALKMSEAMTFVLQRVLNEMLAGKIVHQHEGGIDFNSYLREYWLCMVMADFAVWCGKLAGHDKPLIETATQEDVHEFGG